MTCSVHHFGKDRDNRCLAIGGYTQGLERGRAPWIPQFSRPALFLVCRSRSSATHKAKRARDCHRAVRSLRCRSRKYLERQYVLPSHAYATPHFEVAIEAAINEQAQFNSTLHGRFSSTCSRTKQRSASH